MQSITVLTTQDIYTYGNVEYDLDFPEIVADNIDTYYCDLASYYNVLKTDTL